MKTLIAIATLMTSLSAAAALIEDYPTVKVRDALGSKSVSIKNFCMTEDEKTLKSLGKMKVCEEAEHVGRGYKECLSKAKKQIVIPNEYLVSSCSGPRCSSRTLSSRSFPREMTINVYEFDPRGGPRTKVDAFRYSIPFCR